ncbi:MAG: DEAD/DEAH box helicase [Amphiplicatus sp.]
MPPIIAGRDLLGIAQTGTGKTAAFVLPILHRLSQSKGSLKPRSCHVLVLAPTRELAAQVHGRFEAYGRHLKLHMGLVIGGASIQKQMATCRAGLDILVATPGRLADILAQDAITLNDVHTFVLDEVDQMLDLGFLPAIRLLTAKLPAKRQNIFLSATMPPAIARLANGLLRDPVKVEIMPEARLKIRESVMFLEPASKPATLIDIVKREDFTRGLVFARTKRGADTIARKLNAAGSMAFAIHGNRSQSQRERALNAFRTGAARILVATDIAARGLDIREVSHVVNYDLPNTPETYVHRIGRTARAGAAGVAISFCSSVELDYLRSIEKLTRQRIDVVNGTPRATPEFSGDRPPREKQVVVTAFPGRTKTRMEKEDHDGERGTARIRRRRHRGSAGRKLSRAAG